MSDNRKFCQGQDYYLSGSGITFSATSLTLTSMTTPAGSAIAMTDIGTLGYLTLEPATSQEENVSFTGITQNSDGSATVTGLTRGLRFVAPYTSDSSLRQAHAGGSTVRITNSAPFYNDFANKENDETISQTWTFVNTKIPQQDSYLAPTLDAQFAPKKYVDDVAIAGAPDATETVKGLVELATSTETQAGTSTGGTGARLVPPNSLLTATSSGAGDVGKLAVLGASGTLASGFLPTVPISKGGTGQVTQTLGFNALSPLTTKGDLIVRDGTNNVREPVGSNGQILIADSAQTNGLKWAGIASATNSVSLVAKSTTPVTVSATTSETDLLSVVVPGGTLGTTGVIKGKMLLNNLGSSGAAVNFTFRLKYGATTIATSTPQTTAALGTPSTSQMVVNFVLAANASTSAQVGFFSLANNLVTPFGTVQNYGANGTAAENSAVNETLALSVQLSSSNASNTITMAFYELELS